MSPNIPNVLSAYQILFKNIVKQIKVILTFILVYTESDLSQADHYGVHCAIR